MLKLVYIISVTELYEVDVDKVFSAELLLAHFEILGPL